MSAHPDNALFHALKRIANPVSQEQVHAVADSIGCSEWTSPEGCNRRGECFCATAALRVAMIERAKGAA